MADSKTLIDQSFLEMRGRCLSLAADLDRLDRNAQSAALSGDPRLLKLRQAITVLLDSQPDRAQRVQMIFSDQTPPPAYGKR